ncbi:hypothetical protein SETIT_7G266400v2 [Setaria italica]|uniref:Uncharacterized protein n=1 Tax=Setaria italica TaxID=4555 RepID=A0A368S0B1_SETIT|nr:hypothetical protein SETIT_7G266400v2 [Setaria italica]
MYRLHFGSLIYMYGWMTPRLERKVKERTSLMNDCLTQAIEAAELLLAYLDGSSAQSSGLGKQQPDGMTGNRTSVDKLEEAKELETPTEYYQAQITQLNELEAEISRLQIALESRSLGVVKDVLI